MRNIQAYLQSYGKLSGKLLMASLFCPSPVFHCLLFCKKGDVKVVSFKASSFLLLTFIHGSMLLHAQASGRSVGGNKTTLFILIFHFLVSRSLCMFWVIYLENCKSSVWTRVSAAACAWKNLWSFSVLQESHHDPLLGMAEAGGMGTKPAAGRGLIVAFNNKWVLFVKLLNWACTTISCKY